MPLQGERMNQNNILIFWEAIQIKQRPRERELYHRGIVGTALQANKKEFAPLKITSSATN